MTALVGASRLADADARLAVGAPPLLAAYNAAGVVTAADVHVATRLGGLSGEPDERVLLAVALAVRALRGGSVCVRLDDLDALAVPEGEPAAEPGDGPPGATAAVPSFPQPDGWLRLVRASPLVATGADGTADRPVREVAGRLYLDRYWRDEQLVRRAVDACISRPHPLSADAARPGTRLPSPEQLAAAVRRVFPRPDQQRQRLAAACAVVSPLTVLTGGPGTGKTTTVAGLLAVLQSVAGPDLRVALAAPTGKAAARLQEAVRSEVDKLDLVERAFLGAEPEATTVHRLLGWRPGSTTRFRHDRSSRLPHDVVVVDESSMVSLTLMARLIEALRPSARLVLVGDPDQLASVEAGAVLGDLVARAPTATAIPDVLASVVPADLPDDPAARAALGGGVVRLERRYRFEGAIADLADAVREGRADDALRVLTAGDPAVRLVEPAGDRPSEADLAGVRAAAEAAGVDAVRAAQDGDASAALAALDRHRLLVAHRRGPFGVAHWAGEVASWVAASAARRLGTFPAADEWYLGRPLLVTVNDRDSGLYNGDTGVVVRGEADAPVAAFGDPARPLLVRPHRLPPVETVYAMTVHRGQGSQFGQVSLVLPPPDSPLLTRELLYTAVTRARERVVVVGSEAAVRVAVDRPVRRASGLREPV